MPSVSPGDDGPSSFHQILPGQPVAGYQSTATLIFRWKRYILYISRDQLNILRSPTELVQAITSDEELVSVVGELGDDGRIALASKSSVWLLKPVTSAWNRVTWTKELSLSRDIGDEDDHICSLSWSAEGELLVGGTQYLTLFSTTAASRASSPADEQIATSTLERRAPLWCKRVASPLQFARFSPSANLIATSATHDRLVKIWRRLSFEEAVFDYAYLPHEGIVTHLEWRAAEPVRLEIGQESNDRRSISSYHGGDEQCEILFTLASDAQLRIWRTSGHHDLAMLSLNTIIDLVSAIPHSPTLQTRAGSMSNRPLRYVFLLPSFDYSATASAALKKQPQGKLRHSMEHVREVASRDPDIVITIDTQGRMSAWGVSNIGHKRRPGSADEACRSPFHIAHSDDIGLQIGRASPVPTTFVNWVDGDTINVLMNEFGSGITWWQSNVKDFSSSAAIKDDRGQVLGRSTGGQGAVTGLKVSRDRKTLFSWTASDELTEWTVGALNRLKVHRSSRLSMSSPVLDADSAQRGKSMVTLRQGSIDLMRVADDKGTFTQTHPLHDCQQLRLLRLDSPSTQADASYLIYGSNGHSCIADINPSRGDWQSKEPIVNISDGLHELPILSNKSGSITAVRVLTHPRKAGWLRVVAVTEENSLLRRDISVDSLRNPALDKTPEQTLTFPLTFTSGILDATPNHAALLATNGRSLLIIDVKDGYTEHSSELSSQARNVVLSQPAYDEYVSEQHGLLAILYTNSVDVMARSNHAHGQAEQWMSLKRVSINGTDLLISSVDWLNDGHLAISAGGTLFVSENVTTAAMLTPHSRQTLELSDKQPTTIVGLVESFNSAVVCWQPNVLRTLASHGYFDAIVGILQHLEQKLRFYTSGDQLDGLLDLEPDMLFKHKIDEDGLAELGDQLNDIDLPFTSDDDQEKLKLIYRTVVYILRHRQSLDSNAIKYLFEWRYQVLVEERQSLAGDEDKGTSYAKVVPRMKWREITFAYHSKTQQPLLEILVQHYENKLDWRTVRSLGIALWLHTVKAAQTEGAAMASLEQIFESVGQNAYRASQPPSPADSSLFLLSLRKKAVLLSLWRVAVGNREQKSTSNFLKRDFSVEENRVAARKNAYALMGKRRFEYAAAFFLLADDVLNAIGLLAGQCEDLPLAIAVARTYCGDDSTIAHQFVQDRVVASARRAGDRWMLHWACHISGQYEDAARALVSSFDTIIGDGSPITRSWHQDDPATLIVYRDLRDAAANVKGIRPPTIKVSSSDEYRAILRAARILKRQGLWLLALRLISQWHFVTKASAVAAKDVERNISSMSASKTTKASRVPNLLDSFGVGPQADGQATTASAADDTNGASDMPVAHVEAQSDAAQDRAAKAAALLAKIRAKNTTTAVVDEQTKKKEPTQFKEPSANSLLDNFGF